ncbi:MAG: aldehyde dehydrogenase family protein [Intrasporangium sp.]|uniref:aldehyde dehydrogenase family protein n=1 Tax=Intrasporangium sp. TaxID=1925024 RepID=UPI002647DF44|nr:aldehyde dehydrogenase family protein [Intrasporangium sp.]MDN5796284.1 aldehyde dehydrogenase family protein [Intrasporangium sp.]
MTTVAIAPSYSPRTGRRVDGPAESTAEEVAAVLDAAARAFPLVSATPPAVRAGWLEAIAWALEANADRLAALADEETALGGPRLLGELAKCAASARFYGSVAAAGHWVGALVDTVPGPVPSVLRRANVALGPVAVFGASNFPFGFGVLGHDTCSAIAAGCSVVVKAHPAHPRLSAALAELAVQALAEAGAPDGTFGLVSGFDAGLALVDAPEVSALAFTGSQRAGLALAERAAGREAPIPVFAEMGTVNPVVVTPSAAAGRDAIATGFVGSFTLGQGQFCTKPGLLLVPEGSGLAEAVATILAGAAPGPLLTQAIADGYGAGVERLTGAGGTVLAAAGDAAAGDGAVDTGEGGTGKGGTGEGGTGKGVATKSSRAKGGDAGGADEGTAFTARPVALRVDLDELQPGSPFLQECFGPMALVAEYASLGAALAALARLQPSLAGAVMTAGPHDPDAGPLVAALARQVGRVVVDGWPTGVATSWGMHHGGPWPAASRADATSVGSAALLRFTRPVCFQDVPAAALPSFLCDDNPWSLPMSRTSTW